MRKRSLGLIPAVLALFAPMAQAQKAAPMPEAQTRAALKRLGALYGPAWTLTYESVLTTKTFGPASGTQAMGATVHGVLQKPNKFRLELMQNDKLIGLLVSNGVTVSLFSPQQGLYSQQAAPADLVLGGLALSGKALARVTSAVPVMAMTPTLFSLATRPDFLGPSASDFTASALTLHGREALDCSWTEGGATEHILFNQATGLPLRTIDSNTDKDGVTTLRQEDLAAVQVGSVPLPPSAFEWAPPVGAKPVPDEKAVTPPPPPAPSKPAAQSPAPTSHVLRHRRRTKTAPETSGTDPGRTPSSKIIRPATPR